MGDNLNQKMFQAAKNNHAEEIARLIGAGVDTDIQDADGNTPLIIAASRGNYEALKMLLGYAADTDIQNNMRNTALLVAIENDRKNVIGELLAHRANPNIINTMETNALLLAATKTDANLVRLLLAQPTIRDLPFPDGTTMLDLAEADVFTPVINQLIVHKFNPEEQQTLDIPKNSRNAISFDDIENGNIIVNFRGNAPKSFESKKGRYYKEETLSRLTINPFTREAIQEPTYYVARLPPPDPKNKNKNGGRRRARKTKKRTSHKRKRTHKRRA